MSDAWPGPILVQEANLCHLGDDGARRSPFVSEKSSEYRELHNLVSKFGALLRSTRLAGKRSRTPLFEPAANLRNIPMAIAVRYKSPRLMLSGTSFSNGWSGARRLTGDYGLNRNKCGPST